MRPNIGTTYLRIIPKNLRRRSVVKTAVRSLGIIEDSVLLYHLLCLLWIFKEISTEALIPKLAVEAFKVAVLPRTAFFGELVAYAIFLNKLLKSQASELSPLICSDYSGNTVKPDAIFKYFNHDFSRNTEPTIKIKETGSDLTIDFLTEARGWLWLCIIGFSRRKSIVKSDPIYSIPLIPLFHHLFHFYFALTG